MTSLRLERFIHGEEKSCRNVSLSHMHCVHFGDITMEEIPKACNQETKNKDILLYTLFCKVYASLLLLFRRVVYSPGKNRKFQLGKNSIPAGN
jgi:hypothetical protein